MAEHFDFCLIWVPGHQDISGNCIADELARQGTTEILLPDKEDTRNEITTTANNLDENLASTTDDNESENDVDFNDSVKNTSSKKRRSTSPFGKTRRVRWTIEEKQEMIEIFDDLKSLQKLPSLQECLQIIRNSKNLRELDNQRKSESRKLK
ncbi:hypothetical protein ACLKA6_001029 [Drosophila palustris]